MYGGPPPRWRESGTKGLVRPHTNMGIRRPPQSRSFSLFQGNHQMDLEVDAVQGMRKSQNPGARSASQGAMRVGGSLALLSKRDSAHGARTRMTTFREKSGKLMAQPKIPPVISRQNSNSGCPEGRYSTDPNGSASSPTKYGYDENHGSQPFHPQYVDYVDALGRPSTSHGYVRPRRSSGISEQQRTQPKAVHPSSRMEEPLRPHTSWGMVRSPKQSKGREYDDSESKPPSGRKGLVEVIKLAIPNRYGNVGSREKRAKSPLVKFRRPASRQEDQYNLVRRPKTVAGTALDSFHDVSKWGFSEPDPLFEDTDKGKPPSLNDTRSLSSIDDGEHLDSLSSLPEELLHCILAYLPKRDLVRLKRVNRVLKEASSDPFLWKCLAVSSYSGRVISEPVTAEEKSCLEDDFAPKALSGSRVRFLSDKILKGIPREFTHISSLELVGCVGMSDAGYWSLCKCAPSLEHLTLLRCHPVEGNILQTICKQLSGLKTLRVSGTWLDEQTLFHMGDNLTRLKTLSLSGYSGFTEIGFSFLVANAPLSSLNIHRCDIVDIRAVSSMKHLAHLSVRECMKLNCVFVVSDALVSIDILGCKWVKWYKIICPSLEKLSVFSAQGSRFSSIPVILNNCPKVSSLELVGCMQFSDKFLLSLLGSGDVNGVMKRLELSGTGGGQSSSLNWLSLLEKDTPENGESQDNEVRERKSLCGLQNLRLRDCHWLGDQHLEELCQVLDVDKEEARHARLRGMPGMYESNIYEVDVSGSSISNVGVQNILSMCSSLTKLDLSRCGMISYLNITSSRLVVVRLDSCINMSSLNVKCNALKELYGHGLSKIEQLHIVAPKLRVMELASAGSALPSQGIGGDLANMFVATVLQAEKLEILNARGCAFLMDYNVLDILQGCHKDVVELDMSNNPHIINMASKNKMERLQVLRAEGCSHLRVLDTRNMRQLKEILLSGCPILEQIIVPDAICKIHTIDVRECVSLALVSPGDSLVGVGVGMAYGRGRETSRLSTQRGSSQRLLEVRMPLLLNWYASGGVKWTQAYLDCPSLRVCDMARASNMTDLHMYIPSIEVLALGGSKKLSAMNVWTPGTMTTRAPVRKNLKTMPCLFSLDLSHCDALPVTALQWIQSMCEGLQEVTLPLSRIDPDRLGMFVDDDEHEE